MARKTEGDLVSNRKASHDYEILETLEAGILLQGTEVKSLKAHGGNLQDAYILVSGKRVLLKGANIALYAFGNLHNHEEKRERELLLHKREIVKLKEVSQKQGLALIPLALYAKKGLIKVKIAIAKGKKAYDKREALKNKQHQKEMDRAIKNREE
ncbi:MAG: SsrA-binding protein SmpB [Rhabdochlamydiaceae bacterium]|nr:SsrA-binding protein SmpB [Rhabdochlamydiaceae bacterium]